jgi:hypothetical protein
LKQLIEYVHILLLNFLQKYLMNQMILKYLVDLGHLMYHLIHLNQLFHLYLGYLERPKYLKYLLYLKYLVDLGHLMYHLNLKYPLYLKFRLNQLYLKFR